MRIRELKRTSGAGVVPCWPPSWAASYGSSGRLPTGEEGVLRAVRRFGDRLLLTMEFEGRYHQARLEWTPPPDLDDVERLLRARVGQPMRGIGALEV